LIPLPEVGKKYQPMSFEGKNMKRRGEKGRKGIEKEKMGCKSVK
jgi:hypothetical protein